MFTKGIRIIYKLTQVLNTILMTVLSFVLKRQYRHFLKEIW